MIKLYIIWYGSALVGTVIVWLRSRKMRPLFRRLLITGVIALGFTTVPLGRDGDGALFPMGLFYFSRHSWLEAAMGATLVIGIVWLILFSVASVVRNIFIKMNVIMTRRLKR